MLFRAARQPSIRPSAQISLQVSMCRCLLTCPLLSTTRAPLSWLRRRRTPIARSCARLSSMLRQRQQLRFTEVTAFLPKEKFSGSAPLTCRDCSSQQPQPACAARFCAMLTTVHTMRTWELTRLTRAWQPRGFGQKYSRIAVHLSRVATPVWATRLPTVRPPAWHARFLRLQDPGLRWASICPDLTPPPRLATPGSSCSLTTSPSKYILLQLLAMTSTRSPLSEWQKSSSRLLSSIMGCQTSLFQTVDPSGSLRSGQQFSSSVARGCASLPPTTPRQTGLPSVPFAQLSIRFAVAWTGCTKSGTHT